LNKEEYRQVCEASDSILLAQDSTLERVAIPWLHVLNEHPCILSQYAHLFGPHRYRFRLAFGEVKKILSLIKAFLKPLTSRRQSVLPPKIDVLIISHLLNSSQLNSREDFYFGGIPEALVAKEIVTVVALRDHVGIRHLDPSRSWPTTMAPRILLSEALRGFDELRLKQRLRKEAGRLRLAASRTPSVFVARLYKAAAQEAVGPAAMSTLRLYTQIQEMIRSLRPTSIVVTYEGHSWERVVFAAARSVDPAIRCVGYHHTILFPRQHAISRALGYPYDPDIVFTAGNITKDVLKKTPGMCGIPVITVGTHRQVNLESQFSRKISTNHAPACLVIPDGTMEEFLLIFNFVLKAAIMLPAINFIIRLHPVMQISKAMDREKRLRFLPKNIQISQETISMDFNRCRWALYRGSGAAIHAVSAALRPFYFKSFDEELCIDPLHAMQTWKRIVKSVDDLKACIDADLHCDIEFLDREWLPARNFCLDFFSSLDIEKFCNFVVDERRLNK
jgi:hypothetical protein